MLSLATRRSLGTASGFGARRIGFGLAPALGHALVAFVVLGLFGALATAPLAAQDDFPLSDGIFDWPVGPRGALAQGFYIQQNFGNVDNPVTCYRSHAGIDLRRTENEVYPNDDVTAEEPVYAASRGRVLCSTAPSRFGYTGPVLDYDPGRTLVIEHRLPDGSTVYTMYAHMDNCDPETDTGCVQCSYAEDGSLVSCPNVERGAQLGTIHPDAPKTHLHFEIREFPFWDDTNDEPSFADAPASPKGCPGDGYATIGDTASGLGYYDPIDFVLAHRPPSEVVYTNLGGGLVLEDEALDTELPSGAPRPPAAGDVAWERPAVGDEGTKELFVLGENTPVTPIALFRAPEFSCSETLSEADWAVARFGCTDADQGASSGDDCVDGACDWWYEVEVPDPESPGATRRGFIKAAEERKNHYTLTEAIHWMPGDGFRAILVTNQPSVSMSRWSEPEDEPLLHFGFDAPIADGIIPNEGDVALFRGQASDGASVQAGDLGAGDQALAFDGASDVFDVVLGNVLTASDSAFHLDLRLRPAGLTGRRVVASQWTPGGDERWLLELLPVDAAADRYYAALRFVVRLDDGAEAVATYALPTCDHDGVWSQVSAAYDPAADEIRLYWNDRGVGRASLGGARMAVDAENPAPLRFGGDGTDAASDPERFAGLLNSISLWSENPLPTTDTVLIIDSSGSMGWNDPQNRRHDAGIAYVDAALEGDAVGVVDFDNLARIVAPLSPLPDSAGTLGGIIGSIGAGGGTNIGLGLQRGHELLDGTRTTTENATRAAILLTDGDGSFAGQDQAYATDGWPVYTFGFGASNDSLLQSIADTTGGAFLRLTTEDLVCEFQRVRADLVGGQADPCVDLTVDEDPAPLQSAAAAKRFETSKASLLQVNVAPYSAQATVSISRSSSVGDVILSLRAPSGRVIDRATRAADVLHRLEPRYELYRILAPEAGLWEVEVRAVGVPGGSETVTFGFTTLPTTAQPSNQAPDVSLAAASRDSLWPPNHKMSFVEILGVDDPDGDEVTIEVVAVSQDEPVDGPDGTTPDAEVVDGGVLLRAERDGAGDGRVYHVTFEASDAQGGVTTGTVSVCVPHDRSHRECVDGGAVDDSLAP